MHTQAQASFYIGLQEEPLCVCVGGGGVVCECWVCVDDGGRGWSRCDTHVQSFHFFSASPTLAGVLTSARSFFMCECLSLRANTTAREVCVVVVSVVCVFVCVCVRALALPSIIICYHVHSLTNSLPSNIIHIQTHTQQHTRTNKMTTPIRTLNRLASQVAKLTEPLPPAYKPWGYTFAFDSMVCVCVCVCVCMCVCVWMVG